MEHAHPTGYICMAVYRPRQDLLRRQIDSLRSQSLTEWRCLVGIDGYDSSARAEVEAAVGGDGRFEIVEFPNNVGFYRNFERILELVPSEVTWIALSDQDDEWFPEKLATLKADLGEAAMAFCQAMVVSVDPQGESVATRRRAVELGAEMIDNQVTGSACMFRRDLLNLALPFPEPTDLGFHDHWLGVCALVSGGIFAEPTPLQFYVQHEDNVIGEERTRSLIGRVAGTVSKARGRSSGALKYLSDHRWGWRVSMARRLISADIALQDDDAATLRAFAEGRVSSGLLRVLWRSVMSGEAPAARAIGLLIGSLRSPTLRSQR